MAILGRGSDDQADPGVDVASGRGEDSGSDPASEPAGDPASDLAGDPDSHPYMARSSADLPRPDTPLPMDGGHLGVDLDQALKPGALVPAFQPIVDLASGAVVGFEALARWPTVPGANPGTVFLAARVAGRLAELDWACRLAALRTALDVQPDRETALFVNVEAETFGAAGPAGTEWLLTEARERLRVVLELTERSLLRRPAELLQLIGWARKRGWGIALDDVGADPDSLALLPFVAPDVIKLDLSLVQNTPSSQQARTMVAVMAHAERTGAAILAEGIETAAHREQALALGASYGQGWLLGRPGPLTVVDDSNTIPPARPLEPIAVTPFDHVISARPLRIGRKALLLAMSRHIEHKAMSLSDPPVVLSAFQTADRFTPQTARRYSAIASTCAFVGALGEGLPTAPAPGVRGASLDPEDRLVGEWTVVVVGAHYAGALIARDLGDCVPDLERRFEFVLTHDRDVVIAAGRSLMGRIVTTRPAE
ncbi:sensor domain-containing phosphodiesterase [Jatrophihabitans lederbergiae]|uniref:EAL domain-containing protein n=1 Tax=Jatrophihabitans lederbergiae TaxID=3075547 RepID=A0ABU2J8A4_9ACTN|nr:EAL domain-containing protein [Jatrophihabitans sp. DSM 44399]MDT0261222.1 EAL domain-containing protein [Jatrophihabitans sp. DSM 44399]